MLTKSEKERHFQFNNKKFHVAMSSIIANFQMKIISIIANNFEMNSKTVDLMLIND